MSAWWASASGWGGAPVAFPLFRCGGDDSLPPPSWTTPLGDGLQAAPTVLPRNRSFSWCQSPTIWQQRTRQRHRLGSRQETPRPCSFPCPWTRAQSSMLSLTTLSTAMAMAMIDPQLMPIFFSSGCGPWGSPRRGRIPQAAEGISSTARTGTGTSNAYDLLVGVLKENGEAWCLPVVRCRCFSSLHHVARLPTSAPWSRPNIAGASSAMVLIVRCRPGRCCRMFTAPMPMA